MGLNYSHFTSATRNVFFLAENFLTEKNKERNTQVDMRLSDVNVINMNYRYRAFSLTWSASM